MLPVQRKKRKKFRNPPERDECNPVVQPPSLVAAELFSLARLERQPGGLGLFTVNSFSQYEECWSDLVSESCQAGSFRISRISTLLSNQLQPQALKWRRNHSPPQSIRKIFLQEQYGVQLSLAFSPSSGITTLALRISGDLSASLFLQACT